MLRVSDQSKLQSQLCVFLCIPLGLSAELQYSSNVVHGPASYPNRSQVTLAWYYTFADLTFLQ